MYMKVNVKVGFSLENVGCGCTYNLLCARRKEHYTYTVHLLTLLQAFLLSAYMSLSFSFFLHNVTFLCSVIIENNVFFN